MSSALVRAISAAETRPLRRSVLRPHQTEDALVYLGDDEPTSGHFGAFLDDRLVGVASVFRQANPLRAQPAPYRLRGMATTPEVRGRGIGSLLLVAALDFAAVGGGSHMWCHARVPAVPFYQRHGFRAEGEAFEIQDIGPHLHMERPLGVVQSG